MNGYSKKIIRLLTAILICFLMLFSMISCTIKQSPSDDRQTQTEPGSVTQIDDTAAPVLEPTTEQPKEEDTTETTQPDASTEAVETDPESDVYLSQDLQTNGSLIHLSDLRHYATDETASVVFFTKNITPGSLVDVYHVLTPGMSGKVAVKLTTGESQLTNYLKPELIGDLIKTVDGTVIECMTAYGGVRSTAALSKQAAKDRGYTAIAPFDLLDEDGSLEIPFSGGSRVDRAIVGSHLQNYDSVLVLSHFKGHLMAGFGGAIKNVGIGMSSQKGKIYVHSGGSRTVGTIINSDQDSFLEALAETVKAVSDHMNEGQNMLYISVMNRLSVDCDCMALPTAPDMHDIGILASSDPVALDQACVDLVYAAPDGDSLIRRMEALNGEHVLEHAEKIGLGSRSYVLVSIDE